MALRVSCMPARAPGDDHTGLVASAVGSGEPVRAYEAKPNFMIISGAVRTVGLARPQGPRSLWRPGENACKSAKAFREIALVMEGSRSSLAAYPGLLTRKQQLGNLHRSVQTDAPARWNELETARSNALSGSTPRHGDARVGAPSNRACAALSTGAASLQQSAMQPHEGQGRKPDPDEHERQRQRRMSVRLLLVIAVLLGLLTPLLLKRFLF